MTDSSGLSQVERDRRHLMARRELAERAWRAGHRSAHWPEVTPEHPREIREMDEALAAYLDANVGPLPPPEPQQVTGPSGSEYTLHHCCLVRGDGSLGHRSFPIEPEDRATVANLLCPFEDVVRATLEEIGVTEMKVPGATWWGVGGWEHTAPDIAKRLPAILKRLSR